MTRSEKLKTSLLRFRRDEDGAALLIEFALFVPLLFASFLMAVEMGLYSMREMWLDRGLDVAVRYIRLNTDAEYTHDEIKGLVCGGAGWLENCDESLRLEMVEVDPRNFAQFDPEADCIDTSEPILPVRGFTLGEQNQLMMLRACVKFDPVYPGTGLGFQFAKDGSGQVKMISVAAFVQEPR